MDYNLAKEEAYEAMLSGNKVTREHFTEDEFIFMDSYGHIWSEDGFRFDGWWNTIEPSIPKANEICWGIYKKLKKSDIATNEA